MLIRGATIPLHVQLKNALLMQIGTGDLRPHDVLPGERQLAQSYGLSRTTVRQAVNELVAAGTLYRRQGKGTYVAPSRAGRNLTWLRGFAEELREQGRNPQVRVLVATMCPAPPTAAERLRLSVGEGVAYVQRLVLVGEEPLFIDRTYINAQIGGLLLETDLTSESMYGVVERLGYPIREGAQTVSAERLAPEDAELLQVSSGEATLVIRRVTYIDSDAPIEYAEARYRADRYEYRTRLQRQPQVPR